uniref:Uncharacterized protein n=1 Tax=Amphimedon queenslandica TaxID=400682 RepID=A0A1X7UX02_AMPQE
MLRPKLRVDTISNNTIGRFHATAVHPSNFIIDW